MTAVLIQQGEILINAKTKIVISCNKLLQIRM
ncbi:hypothetical protein X965_19125 [Morganella sp. EGD-HP17]|nr:hypothetical protein X965_19125 [Morganella sp. EGD-HP17]